MSAHRLNPLVPRTQHQRLHEQRLHEQRLHEQRPHEVALTTSSSAHASTRQQATEVALLHLLEARWQFFADTQHQPDSPQCDSHECTRYDGRYVQSNDPIYLDVGKDVGKDADQDKDRFDDVIAYWHLSNARLEHTLEQLSQHVLEHHMIDLNHLITSIINFVDGRTHLFETEPYLDNLRDNLRGVDIGIAIKLPVVIAPPQLLRWVFSELLISHWFNSLPTKPQPLAAPPIATVAVSCLDTDDAWHITVSSDHHQASLTTASLEQFKMALQHFGGDIYTAYDDHASLQTVVLPKCPHLQSQQTPTDNLR